MTERKGALLSSPVATIAKEYGCIVEPVFNKNGVGHPVPPNGKLPLEDLARFNPAWQAQQELERRGVK